AYVLGVRVDRLSQRQALDSIEQIIVQWRASDRAQVCQQIVTVNPEFVMNAQRNKDFRTAINAAALIVADGMGVVWATRYLGRPVPERVTGTDLLPELSQRCDAAGYRL
ncbi:MAG: glycosyl transferase, partial [Chloroflexi bacterium]